MVIGIAGGTRSDEQSLGDVLVADKIVYYEPQKIRADGQELRHRSLEADARLYDRALNLRSDNWWNSIPSGAIPTSLSSYSPKVHFGPLASGEKVIADIDKINRLRNHIPKLVGVEMESVGVASAAFSAAKQIDFSAVRAISDFAKKK
ncbi:MAG: 5'-methylthioadenosine/S-adenosylhomocysteine nucleosidase [Desulfobulbaceae bacterium]|nr:5'-methylthioadenosine/S-adenosylhomocysteine nucleosidase [Desulfobulbaceae bacterium]